MSQDVNKSNKANVGIESILDLQTQTPLQQLIGAQSFWVTIALLITVDHGVEFAAQAGRELAELLRELEIDIIVSVATMGIPLAIETTRALGLDDYVILHKTQKIHLADGEWEYVRSITTDANQ